MRWGIQDAATVDHSTCELCLMEIRTCKRLSMGPHFVVNIYKSFQKPAQRTYFSYF